MDKGIRQYCNNMFVKLNEDRRAGKLTNREFRKNITEELAEQFGIKITAAATHYNHSFIQAKKETPELVEGLGRAANKKGGRKRKVVKEAEIIIASDEQTEFEVRKKSDNSVVQTGLSFEDARTLVSKAAAQKKAKLYWV